MNKNNNIEIFSIGGYSSWCYYKPFRALFDCGEGFATHFRNKIFGVDSLYLSHVHSDHLSGIPQFLNSRTSARGDKEKELTIYYPISVYGQEKIDAIKTLTKFNKHVKWVGILPDFKQDITNKHYIKAFKTRHSKESLGYIIYEKRTRLKREYKNRNQHEIKRLVASGEKISEQYEFADFVYALDNCGFSEEINGCNWFIQDANFLNPDDKERNTHNTLSEAINKANEIDAKNTILTHVSSRYFNEPPKVKVPNGMVLLDKPIKFKF